MKHTISALVENKFGVLARVSGLFSARGYNINSLAVSETNDPSVSCMTIVVDAADERILEQIKKQLNRLIDVISVVDLTKKDYIDRELILAKTSVKPKDFPNLKGLCKKFKANLLLSKPERVIIELTAEQLKVNQFLQQLEPFGINELVRTGKVAVVK